MNNFSKSIVYSGLVLAAGLVAIFAVYNNMSERGAAGIEPAAGESTMETTIDVDTSQAADPAAVQEEIQEENAEIQKELTEGDTAVEEAAEAIDNAVTTPGETADEVTTDTIDQQGDMIEERIEDAKAAQDAASQEPAAAGNNTSLDAETQKDEIGQ